MNTDASRSRNGSWTNLDDYVTDLSDRLVQFGPHSIEVREAIDAVQGKPAEWQKVAATAQRLRAAYEADSRNAPALANSAPAAAPAVVTRRVTPAVWTGLFTVSGMVLTLLVTMIAYPLWFDRSVPETAADKGGTQPDIAGLDSSETEARIANKVATALTEKGYPFTSLAYLDKVTDPERSPHPWIVTGLTSASPGSIDWIAGPPSVVLPLPLGDRAEIRKEDWDPFFQSMKMLDQQIQANGQADADTVKSLLANVYRQAQDDAARENQVISGPMQVIYGSGTFPEPNEGESQAGPPPDGPPPPPSPQ